MRPTFKQVLKQIANEVKAVVKTAKKEDSLLSDSYEVLLVELEGNDSGGNAVDMEPLYEVEILVEGFKRCFPDRKLILGDIWSILLGHDYLYPGAKSKSSLDILRIHFKKEVSYWNFIEKVDMYMSVYGSEKQYSYVQNEGIATGKGELQQTGPFMAHRKLLYDMFFDPYFHQHKKTAIPPILKEEEPVFFINFGNENDDAGREYTFPSHLFKLPLQNLPNKLNRIKKEMKAAGATTHQTLQRLLDALQLGEPVDTKTRNRSLVEKLKSMQFELNINPHEHIASYMDKNGGRYNGMRSYSNATQSFSIRRKQNKKAHKFLRYKRVIHMIGKTGSGKNTFLELETARMVRDHDGKVGILCTKVQDCMNLVTKLRHLGIKAVPIIGESKLEEHFYEKLEAKKNALLQDEYAIPINEVKDDSLLRYYSKDCLLKDLVGASNLKFYPCTDLYVAVEGKEKRERRICPFFSICGACTRDRELVEADVWVATIESYYKSKPKKIFNAYGKTYGEIGYDELDVMFVDEVDSLQERADSLTIAENDLVGSDICQFENELLKIRDNHVARNHGSSNHPIYNQFLMYSNHATDVIRLLFGLLMDSKEIRDWVKNRSFGIHEIFNETYKEFFGGDALDWKHPFIAMLNEVDLAEMPEDKNLKKLKNKINGFIAGIQTLKTSTAFNSIERRQNEIKRIKRLLKFFFKEANVKPVNGTNEFNLSLFYFAILLKSFDTLYKKLIYIIQSYNLFGDSNIDTKYGSIRTYLPFIPEAGTERNFQYQYIVRDGEETGLFKMYQYLGFGRQLLLNYPYLYKNIEGRLGPSMVYMSGTSKAPGSPHFDIKKEVDYIIESTRPSEAKMDIKLKQIPDNKTGETIYISGTRLDTYKLSKLKDMCESQELRNLIEGELDYWESKGEGRKILIITSSYPQAHKVTETLSQYFPYPSVRMLTNGDFHNVPTISKGLVEQFANFEADILVAPMKTISTGYNILKNDESGQSLFGSVLFLVRPMPSPGSIQDTFKILNGKYEDFMRDGRAKGKTFYEGTSYLKARSLYLLKDLIESESRFMDLPKDTRRYIAWYVFKDFRQTIGRLQRGNTDCRVLLVDGSWYGGKESKRHILKEFLDMLEDGRSEETEVLYSDTYEALEKLLKEMENLVSV